MNVQLSADRRARVRARVVSLPASVLLLLAGCGGNESSSSRLGWYVFDERSGSFEEAARRCTEASAGAYRIEIVPLPADADQQREQLVRRLAAGDPDIDIMGMDVIWTAEFAAAGWILPWEQELASAVSAGRLEGPLRSARYRDRLWAVPFTTNAQILWYRTDRVPEPPATWNAMIETAQALREGGRIAVQGERYEGLTVFFASLLASAGGRVLEEGAGVERGAGGAASEGADSGVALSPQPTREALRILHRLATSSTADPGLDRAREDQARMAFESGRASFMVNYTFVWASARQNAPEVAEHMAWARWPAVLPGRPSRVTVGGINLGVSAHSPHPEEAFEAAACLASEENQRLAAARAGLPPTTAALYDEPEVRETFPFADLLRETLRDAVQRPQTPLYADVSLAITRVLHPLGDIDPQTDALRLQEAVARALRSQGLF